MQDSEQRYNYLVSDIKSSKDILRLMYLEYIKEDFNLFIDDTAEKIILDLYEDFLVCYNTGGPNTDSIVELNKNKEYVKEIIKGYLLRENFVYILSSIFMDNIFYYIRNSSVDQFLNILNEYKLPYCISVRNLYIDNLVTHISTNLYTDKDSIFPIIKRSVLNLLTGIYMRNTNEFNQSSVMVLEEMTYSLSHIKPNSYFFQIDNFSRPVFIFR